MYPQKFILIDIDGLKPDVFQAVVDSGQAPNLEKIVRDRLSFEITAPAPSITFCSQACLFTGAHPADHGIPGNQFFDRFGRENQGVPRHYAFDVGDTLAVDDAVRVFTDGLASTRLQTETIYERFSRMGKSSVVAGNMYAKGADHWIKPSLVNIARFTKGGNLFGMSSSEYDQHILDQLTSHIEKYGLPDLTTLYFMGLDHDSHVYGPENAQAQYLTEHLDPLLGQFWQLIESKASLSPLVALFSDHGQIQVPADDEHSLKIGFPFDKEVAHFFAALGLDVHDFPGEDPNCDAVMALNGGIAFVYLQKRDGRWADRPGFQRDVMPVAKAFWQAHLTGKYADELHGALAAVLVRNVQEEGWSAGYQALTPEGGLVSLQSWFDQQPGHDYINPVHRLNNMVSPFAGDLVLLSNYPNGYYFGGEMSGVHGGLHPDDSLATLSFSWPGASADDWQVISRAINSEIMDRCDREGNRMASTCDLLTGIEAVVRMSFGI